MTVVTYTGNTTDKSGTRQLVFRDGGLVMPIYTYADLASNEIAQAQALGAVLMPGQVAGSTPANLNNQATIQGGTAYIQTTKPTPAAGQFIIWLDSSVPSSGIFRVDDQGNLTPLASGLVPITTITADHVLSLADVNAVGEGILRTNSTDPITVTVPNNTTVPFPLSSCIEVHRGGTGAATIAAASGVTITPPAGAMTIAAQYGSVNLLKLFTNGWNRQGAFG